MVIQGATHPLHSRVPYSRPGPGRLMLLLLPSYFTGVREMKVHSFLCNRVWKCIFSSFKIIGSSPCWKRQRFQLFHVLRVMSPWTGPDCCFGDWFKWPFTYPAASGSQATASAPEEGVTIGLTEGELWVSLPPPPIAPSWLLPFISLCFDFFSSIHFIFWADKNCRQLLTRVTRWSKKIINGIMLEVSMKI